MSGPVVGDMRDPEPGGQDRRVHKCFKRRTNLQVVLPHKNYFLIRTRLWSGDWKLR